MFKKLNKSLHTPTWLFILLLVVLILRIPTLLEPYAYGDEMIYLTLGEGIRQGIPLYAGIHDNKPPLLYIAAAIAGNVFWFRVILAIWNIATIFVFWKLVEKLFPKKLKLQQIATAVFAILTTIPFLEGNIPNSEMFMIGTTILAFYILLSKKADVKNILISGALLSISALFKMPAAFEVPVIIFFWFATMKYTTKNLLKFSKKTIILGLGFLIPILITMGWYWITGSGREYLLAAYGQNFGYLSSFRPDDIQEPFLTKNAPLIGRGALMILGLLLLVIYRGKLSKQYIFLTAWLLMTIFAVTLPERPYPHYLIQSVPPLSILFAMLFTLRTIEQVLTILPITAFLIAPVYFKFWYYPSTPYYLRFYNFATKQISQEEYLGSFGENVVKDYKIADYIANTSSEGDRVFVWGDNATIYAISGKLPPIKYVVDYHIRDFSTPEETIVKLNSSKPALVVILPTGESFSFLDQFVKDNYMLVKTINNGQVWKLVSPNMQKLLQ